MELSENERCLLHRLRKGTVTFTGEEPEASHLAMLQLWTRGYVEPDPDEEAAGPIRWCLTRRGTAVAGRLPR